MGGLVYGDGFGVMCDLAEEGPSPKIGSVELIGQGICMEDATSSRRLYSSKGARVLRWLPGKGPASFGGIEYDVEINFREKALLSRIKFPETRVFLLAGDRERRQIAAIDHNQSGVGSGVRIAGWLMHPDLDRIIVFLLAQRRWSGASGAAPYYLLAIAVEIGE